MFDFSVRLMDGSSLSIVATPEMTVAELRAVVRARMTQKHALSSLHDVALFQNTQEILNGGSVQVEVQAVVTPTIDKALDVLSDCMDIVNDAGGFADDALVADAITVLREGKTLTHAQCELLLDILGGYARRHRTFLGINSLLDLGMIFGRACGDPTPYIPKMSKLLVRHLDSSSVGMFVAIAGIEIAKRSRESIPSELCRQLMNWGELVLETLDGASHSQAYGLACELLGLLSFEESHVRILERCLDHLSVGQREDELIKKQTQAVQRILDRTWHVRGEFVEVDGLLYRTGLPERPSNCDWRFVEVDGLLYRERLLDVDGSIADDAGAEEVTVAAQDTDHGLEAALERSELEALLREQEDLHKTILHSKIDCQQRLRREPGHSAEQPDGLVLLCFQSCRKELFQSLLRSPMAMQLASNGVQLQPEVATGRLILAEGVAEATIAEARGPWHVAVRVADEYKVYDILRESLGRQRPRVMKEDGRFLVPGDVSLFDDTSSVSQIALQERWWEALDIKRTFLQTKLAPTVPAKRASSTPLAIPSQRTLSEVERF